MVSRVWASIHFYFLLFLLSGLDNLNSPIFKSTDSSASSNVCWAHILKDDLPYSKATNFVSYPMNPNPRILPIMVWLILTCFQQQARAAPSPGWLQKQLEGYQRGSTHISDLAGKKVHKSPLVQVMKDKLAPTSITAPKEVTCSCTAGGWGQ